MTQVVFFLRETPLREFLRRPEKPGSLCGKASKPSLFLECETHILIKNLHINITYIFYFMGSSNVINHTRVIPFCQVLCEVAPPSRDTHRCGHPTSYPKTTNPATPSRYQRGLEIFVGSFISRTPRWQFGDINRRWGYHYTPFPIHGDRAELMISIKWCMGCHKSFPHERYTVYSIFYCASSI